MKKQDELSDRFGGIQINPGLEKEVPEAGDNDRRQGQNGPAAIGPADSSPLSAAPDAPAAGRNLPPRRQRPVGCTCRFRPGRPFFWIMLPFALAALYGIVSFFLVPVLVKGPLASNVSARIDRPVRIRRVLFSPFTLRFFFRDISIGAVSGDRNSRKLLDCGSLECDLSIASLFRRQLIFRQLVVDRLALNLVRFPDSSYNLATAYRLLFPATGERQLPVWPRWLVLSGIRVTDSRILFDDRVSGDQHRIEKINLSVPSFAGLAGRQDVTPQLSAVINGSPVRIKGVTSRAADGSLEARASLHLERVNLKDYLAYLPRMQGKIKLSDGQADIDLELVLPQASVGLKGLFLRGDVSFRALHLQSRDGLASLKIPTARMKVQIKPLAQQYRFKDIVLTRPELTLTFRQKKKGPRQGGGLPGDIADLAGLFQESAFGLRVDRLRADQGRVNLRLGTGPGHDALWNDVHLELAGLVSPGYGGKHRDRRLPASYVMSGRSISRGETMKASVQGRVDADLGMAGRLTLNNVDLAVYRSLLPAAGVSLSRGRLDLDSAFTFRPRPGGRGAAVSDQGFRLHDGSLRLRGFSMAEQGRKILSGQELSCRGLQADFAGRRLSCQQLRLVKDEIFPARRPAGRAGRRDSWRTAVQSLEVQRSILHVVIPRPLRPGRRGLPLTLADFSLQADGLQLKNHKKDNVSAAARIGKKGRIKVNGTYSLVSRQGKLQVTISDLALRTFAPFLSSWFVPKIRQGVLHARGVVTLPARDFAGLVWLDDVAAGAAGKPLVRWRQAMASGVALSLRPFRLTVDEITVEKPLVAVGWDQAKNGAGRFFRRPRQPDHDGAGQIFSISRIYLSDGRFVLPQPVVLPGYRPELNAIDGTILSVSPAGHMVFNLHGKIGSGGDFTINGTTGFQQVDKYTLKVSGLPLAPLQAEFRRRIQADVRSATGQWQQVFTRTASAATVTDRVRIRGLRPAPGSEFAGVLSLLTDENDTIELQTTGEHAPDSKPPLLMESVFERLRYQRVKAALAPGLVVKEVLPQLELPEQVPFAPGKAELAKPESLAGYGILLRKRPYLRLVLTGSYDPVRDRAALLNVLQKEADRQRRAENRRRAEQRRKIAAREKARLAAISAGSSKVVSEKISPGELDRDLQPLPPVQVQVSSAMLQKLARQRLAAVRDYLLRNPALAKQKISAAEKVQTDGALVSISLQPDFNRKKVEKGTPDDT